MMLLQSLEAFVIFIFTLPSTLHQAPHHYRLTKSSLIFMISSVKMLTVTYHHWQIPAILRLETVILYFFNELLFSE